MSNEQRDRIIIIYNQAGGERTSFVMQNCTYDEAKEAGQDATNGKKETFSIQDMDWHGHCIQKELRVTLTASLPSVPQAALQAVLDQAARDLKDLIEQGEFLGDLYQSLLKLRIMYGVCEKHVQDWLEYNGEVDMHDAEVEIR